MKNQLPLMNSARTASAKASSQRMSAAISASAHAPFISAARPASETVAHAIAVLSTKVLSQTLNTDVGSHVEVASDSSYR